VYSVGSFIFALAWPYEIKDDNRICVYEDVMTLMVELS
jgi:hypothetical protein